MELAWCRSFIAVHEMGGFTAAGRGLHRSQSRVSAHVADLERHLGERLLHRDVHPPTLTPAGEAFLAHARGVTDEWDAAVAAVAGRRGQVAGVVAVGSVPSVSSQILAPLIADFAREAPRVTFEVHEGPNTWLDDALARRTVEVALRPVLQGPPPAVEQRVLLDDPFVVVVRRDHALADQDAVTLDQLAGLSVITTGEAGLDAKIGVEFRDLLETSDVDRARSMAVTQPTTVFSFVRSGIGVGVIGTLPAQMLTDQELTYRPLDHPRASRAIGARWATTRRLSPAASAFLDRLTVRVAALPGGRPVPRGRRP